MEENKTQVQINAQYVKEISFKSPSVPNIFSKIKESPKIDLNLNIQIKDIETDAYEVTLVITAKALKDIETIFTVNLEYSGLFKIVDCPTEDQKKQILMIYCPSLLFPFARRVIADITRDGGFMPLMVNPIDFASLYLQQQTQGVTVH